MWSPTHVQVTVCRAKGLLTKGKHGTNDAFVTIGLGKEKFLTSVKQKAGQDVDWQEECELTIPTQGNTAEIVLTVLHQNFLGVDEFLGMVSLPLANLDVYERPRPRWHQLKSKPGQEGKTKYRGELEVQVAFTVKSGSMLDLSTKKDKHRGSLSQISQAASSLGGSLMSLGSKEKKGIKKLASSVGSKLKLPGRGEKGDFGKFSRHGSGRRSDKYSSGEPDPGVISEDEDEFRFDELSHKSSGSSLNITASRNTSVSGSLENLGGGEFLRRNNSMPRGQSAAHLPPSSLTISPSESRLQTSPVSAENPPKPPRSLAAETKDHSSPGKRVNVSLGGEEDAAGIPSIVVHDKLEQDEEDADVDNWGLRSSKKKSKSRNGNRDDLDRFDIVPDLTPIVDEKMEQMNSRSEEGTTQAREPLPLPRKKLEPEQVVIPIPSTPQEPVKEKKGQSVQNASPAHVSNDELQTSYSIKIDLPPLSPETIDTVPEREIPTKNSLVSPEKEILEKNTQKEEQTSFSVKIELPDPSAELEKPREDIQVKSFAENPGHLVIQIGNNSSIIETPVREKPEEHEDLFAEEAEACEYLERVLEESEKEGSIPEQTPEVPAFIELASNTPTDLIDIPHQNKVEKTPCVTPRLLLAESQSPKVSREAPTPDWDKTGRSEYFTPQLLADSSVRDLSGEVNPTGVVELDWVEPESIKEDSVESQGFVDSRTSGSPTEDREHLTDVPHSPDSAVSEGNAEMPEIPLAPNETSQQSSKKSLQWDFSDLRIIETPPTERPILVTSTPRIGEAAAADPLLLSTNERQKNLAASLHQRVVVGEDAASAHYRPNLAQSETPNYHSKSREELLSLLQTRDQQVSDLKEYIGKLLVRVMEECPSLLQTPFEKAGGK